MRSFERPNLMRQEVAMVTKSEATEIEHENPIILDLGKHRRKQIRRLSRGKGKLMAEVSRSIEELRVAGKISKSAQPLIVIVKERLEAPGWLLPNF